MQAELQDAPPLTHEWALKKVDRGQVHRCPACNTPALVGRLGPGTHVEIKCKRHDCERSRPNAFFYVIVPGGEANAVTR